MRPEAEITFQCSGCGQRLCVDASGAGQTTACPACQEILVVPGAMTQEATWQEPGEDRQQQHALEKLESESRALREQLVEAMRVRVRTERSLVAARTELEALQLRLQHAEEEKQQVAASLEQLQMEKQAIDEAYAQLHAQYEDLREHVIARDADFNAQTTALHNIQQALEKGDAERKELTGELLPLREEVKQLRERVTLIAPLEGEVAGLKMDLAAGKDAQECNRLRLRAEAAEEKQKVQHSELEEAKAQMEQVMKVRDDLTRELNVMEERCAAAQKEVDALSESKVHADNQVLRSILARQKAELENCYRDLKRFRRAQLGLRLAYALFALGLLGVAVFALQVLPGIADVF